MLVMSRIEETGFVIAGTLFGREDHTGGRITIVASQAPLIPAAGPNGAVVEVFESDFSLLMFVHIVTSDAIFIVNRSAYMAGAPAKISARSDNLSAKTLLLTVTARTQAITGGETVLVSMASRAVAAQLMLVVRGRCRSTAGCLRRMQNVPDQAGRASGSLLMKHTCQCCRGSISDSVLFVLPNGDPPSYGDREGHGTNCK
jgi:hypothetical protein